MWLDVKKLRFRFYKGLFDIEKSSIKLIGMTDYKYMVGVACTTFNQALYIGEAIKGFVIQKTTFPFVVVIVDDASTDGEQSVITELLLDQLDHSKEFGFRSWETDDLLGIEGVHKENRNCHIVALNLKKNLFRDPKKDELIRGWFDSKYIALCEGDDYWTDPLKLQKQVDFMETHLDFSMCIHGADVKNESTREIWAKCETIETREYFSKDVFPDWVVPTASILYRKDCFIRFKIKHFDWFVARDIVYILIAMHTGRVWAMAEHMSVYRMNNFSLSALKATTESRAKMCKHYEALMLNFSQVDRDFCNHYIAEFNYTRFRKEDSWKIKLKHLVAAIKASPRYVVHKFLRIR